MSTESLPWAGHQLPLADCEAGHPISVDPRTPIRR